MTFLSFFKQVLNKSPFKIFVLVAFIIISGSLEGVGFTLFIPLVRILTSSNVNAAVAGGNIHLLQKLFAALGPLNSLVPLLVIIVVIIMFKNIFLFFEKLFIARISIDFEVGLKQRISESVLASDWRFYLNQKAGTLVNAMGQASKISAMAFQVASQLCAEIVNVTLYCAVGLLISWQAFLMSMSVGVVYVLLSKNIIYKSRTIGTEGVDASNKAQKCILEDFTGIKFIKSNYLEEHRKANLFDLIKRIGDLELEREKYSSLLDTLPEVIMVAVMCLVFYISYVYFKVPGENLLVLLAILYRFNRRVMAVQTLKQRFVNYLPSFELCSEIIDGARKHKEVNGITKFTSLKDGIVFDNVRFSYTGIPVLKAVSLEIKKSAFVAFLGKSGSGKTSIMDLITGLLKAQGGSVKIDGRRIEDYDIYSWRGRIGYVSQDPFLINGSIFDNIKMGNLNATKKEIMDSAKAAYAHEFIDGLKDGYDAIVGDNGVNLSGGQRQRIALARALVRKPEVLILDEATSALDNKSEGMIQKAINELKGKLAILVVAHRLSSIQGADIIYLLNDGCIVDSGNMQSLKDSSKFFKELYL